MSSRLFGDVYGLVLFLVWLALPPLYVVVLGRHYVRRCRELYDALRTRECGCRCQLPARGDEAGQQGGDLGASCCCR